MKRILAILVALATILSLSACGNYEINFKEKDDGEKSVVDSADENDFEEDEEEEKEDKKDKKDKENKKDKGDKDNEEETEEEIVVDGVPNFTKDIKKNQKLLEAYLKTFIDIKGYEDIDEDSDDEVEEYGNLSKSYSYDKRRSADIDYEIAIDGNQIPVPGDYADLEDSGFDFKSSVYNSDSEFKGNTYGNIDMITSDDKNFEVTFFNKDSSASKLSDCMVIGFRFDNQQSYLNCVDFSVNGIEKDSSLEEIIEEFGNPQQLNYNIFEDGRVYVSLRYYNYTDGKTWSDGEMYISYLLTEEQIDLLTYEIPANGIE